MSGKTHWAFNLCVAVSLLSMAAALHRWGAREIRSNIGEVLLLTFIAAVWMILATTLFSWLGLSFRDDVIERNNNSALVALCGALLSVSIIYIGGSLGEGPSYLNNFFSAGLGTAGLLVLWVTLE